MDDETINLFIVGSNILSVILGAGISALISWISITKETKLRVRESVFQKRIDAHEKILGYCHSLRTTISLSKTDNNGNVITYPSFLDSYERFRKIQDEFYEAVNYNSHWLNIELIRELNFIQDYMENLKIYLKGRGKEVYILTGIRIKDDIISLSTELENKTLEFFRKDIFKIRLKPSTGYHKFKKVETVNRLNGTELLKLIYESRNETIEEEIK